MSTMLRFMLPVLLMASVVIGEPVNTICPMMTDEKIVDEDNVVEFNGQQEAIS